tara:strand:- start:2143 stop:2619 length:477 start_codon:yes stop_codon:yes gene_type:complete
MRNKRGDLLTLETLIFTILNLVFFSVLIAFVMLAGQRAFVYEQTYAKQIALIIDNAKPEMAILVDMEKIVEIAEKNEKPLNEIVKINKKENRVEVSLRDSGGSSFQYFSNYDVLVKFEESNKNKLLINILEKTEVEEEVEVDEEESEGIEAEGGVEDE